MDEIDCKIIVIMSLSLGTVGIGISKRLEFSIDERISLPYLNSALTYSAILLIAVIYLIVYWIVMKNKSSELTRLN